MLWEVKIQTQYTNTSKKDLWILKAKIKAEDLFIWSHLHGTEQVEAELCIFNLKYMYLKAFWHLPDWSQAVVRQHLGIPAKRVFLGIQYFTRHINSAGRSVGVWKNWQQLVLHQCSTYWSKQFSLDSSFHCFSKNADQILCFWQSNFSVWFM